MLVHKGTGISRPLSLLHPDPETCKGGILNERLQLQLFLVVKSKTQRPSSKSRKNVERHGIYMNVVNQLDFCQMDESSSWTYCPVFEFLRTQDVSPIRRLIIVQMLALLHPSVQRKSDLSNYMEVLKSIEIKLLQQVREFMSAASILRQRKSHSPCGSVTQDRYR